MNSGKRKHISQRQNLISRTKYKPQSYRKSFPAYNYTAQQVITENKESFCKIIKKVIFVSLFIHSSLSLIHLNIW